MTELSHLKAPSGAESQRPTKFTPENIRQIINLVDRGKNREEIAEIIGVTPGTLAVTCSKLGISLRRPFVGASRPPVGRSHTEKGKNGDRPAGRQEPREPQETTTVLHEQRQQPDAAGDKPAPDKDDVPAIGEVPGFKRQPCAVLDIVMKYKGEARTTELPLTDDIIGRLAVEAEFRSVKLADLVAQLLVAITNRDLFQCVLDGPS
jgi:hypothetical protein